MIVADLSRHPVSNPRIKWDNIFCLLILLLVNFADAHADKNPTKTQPENTSNEITQTRVKAKIEELNAKKEFDEVSKTRLLSLYQATLDNLTNIESYNAKSVEFEAAIKQAPDKTKKVEREIEQTQQKSTKQKGEDFSRISGEELDQRLILEKEKINGLDEQIQKLEKELSVQDNRPQLIRDETIAAQLALETAQKKSGTLAAPASKLEAEAKQMQQNTFMTARNAELKMLSSEANSNLKRVDLLKAELQLLNMQKGLLNPVVLAIESLTNERRQQEAANLENELTQAEKTASGKHPLIHQITRENIQYSRDLQLITSKIETYNELKNRAEASASEIEADFKSAEKKISLAGLSPVLGKVLRKQRRNLTSQGQLDQDSETIQNEMALTSLEQFKIEDKLKPYSDMDAYLKDLMVQQVDKALPSEERMKVQAELRGLLNNQKDLLNKLSAADNTYLRTLGDFDFSKQRLMTQANKFAAYLDERLLWVPSSVPVNSEFLSELYHSTRWLLSPFNWWTLVEDTTSIAWQNFFLTILVLLASALLPMARSWAKKQLVLIADVIGKIYTDNFNHTLNALAFTLILVLPLPVFVYLLGWFLSGNSHGADFSKAMGVGLQSTAVPLFVLEFLYRLFSANGIAIKHFQWQKETANFLKKQVAWLRFVIIPCVFIISSSGASALASHSDSIGRLALIVEMVGLSVFFSRLLNPSTGLLQAYIKSRHNDWLVKLRYLWYPLVVAIPIIITGFAIAGYYLSALELQQKLIITVRLVFAVVIIYELAIRWLTLVNRKLALKNARQKRKTAALNEKQVSSEEGVGGDDPALPVDEQLIDIPTIKAQTIKLLVVFIGISLIVGFWMIWSNILPAFSFLDRIELWQQLVMVDNQETYKPVTLTDLLMAGMYIFIVVVSVRNFPGLMELLVFSRFSIEAGGRYAVIQLAKYLIISIGFLCIANQLGGSWSQVQWLVAALSVGLGFGLQEIFANLVSGIILLFERPIRVGDTVTISNVTGKVSRIQMRATTLLDADQKELIVPNKTFITSQLVNWTLSDAITRIVIPVKIAYGSDVELAHKVMIETVRAMPLVLEDPAPGVVFTGFGEHGMEFSIRVFVSELANRLPVTHKLHVNLEKALRENGIQIPAPMQIAQDEPKSK